MWHLFMKDDGMDMQMDGQTVTMILNSTAFSEVGYNKVTANNNLNVCALFKVRLTQC